jgi:hypothetical protein
MIDEILSRLRDAANEDERFWVALEFNLRTKDPFIRDVISVAAIPHWFDADFLGWLLGRSDFGDSPEYEALIKLPFVEMFSERGYNIHERTRTLYLDRLWKQSRFQYQELSQRAYEYCSQYVEQDDLWLAEAVYHGVMANIPEARDMFLSKCAEWNNHFEYSKLEMLIRPVLDAAETGKLTGRTVSWALYYQARLLAIYNQTKYARRILVQSFSQAEGDVVLWVNCLKSLGRIHLPRFFRLKQTEQQATT